jgi:hypothetical protein
MLAIWAQKVMADAHLYYQAAMKAAWTARAIDYGEDWSPDEQDLKVTLGQTWVQGYQLVMSAYQLERWIEAYGGEHDARPEHLQALRNSLEHLDGATFSEFTARKSSANRAFSIDYLPGAELFLGFRSDYIDSAFGLVDLRDVTDRAREYLHIDEPPEYDGPWER